MKHNGPPDRHKEKPWAWSRGSTAAPRHPHPRPSDTLGDPPPQGRSSRTGPMRWGGGGGRARTHVACPSVADHAPVARRRMALSLHGTTRRGEAGHAPAGGGHQHDGLGSSSPSIPPQPHPLGLVPGTSPLPVGTLFLWKFSAGLYPGWPGGGEGGRAPKSVCTKNGPTRSSRC